MLTFSLTQNEEELKNTILKFFKESTHIKLGIEKKYDLVIIFEGEEINQLVSLEDKIRRLIEILLREKRGLLYRSVISYIERLLIEFLFEYTEANKSKTAEILGINRNTLEAKIKKLTIQPLKFKR
ncbi:MAG: hypothetical protein N2Z79_05040 [Candidatus Omnitrophica bacterium]|nr:hypothetical protein [Candidatus Omnitrophota bacterium]